MCLVCGDELAVMKKANLEHHYSSKYAKRNELGGQMHLDKTSALKCRLESQQAAFTRPCCDRDNLIQMCYVVSKLITKKLRPHIDGESVKERMVAAAGLLAPDKVKLFRVLVCLREQSQIRLLTARDTEKTLKDSVGEFQFFSLACDETTDITNTAQLAVFIRGITAEFDMREELLSLKVSRGTIKERICLRDLFLSMKKLELTFEK